MSKFAKNRQYLFERTSPVTPNCTKTSVLSENSSNINKKKLDAKTYQNFK